MLRNIPESVSSMFLHTGNMLYYTDVTKQVNMLTTEQVCENYVPFSRRDGYKQL